MNPSPAIARRFLRSVHLARDVHSDWGLSGYIVTPSARRALMRVIQGLAGANGDRAFTLTGPFGSGKSSFALFLCHLLRERDGEAWELLRKADSKLAGQFRQLVWPKGASKGYACLPATSSTRQSVSALLADAIEGHVGTLPAEVSGLAAQLRQARDPKDALRLVEDAVKAFRAAGHAGVLFVFDEFGRVFENARLRPTETDVSLLQDLAEAASRSGKAGMALIGILQQGFGDYAVSDPAMRKEFSKIEGRFDPISFSETPAAQIQLVSVAIGSASPTTKQDASVVDQALRLGLPRLLGLPDQDFIRYARASRPLHPLALAALPVLFRRLGQNERSVFTYLAGHEPLSFAELCDRDGPGRRIGLEDLYDYLFTNFETHLGLHAFGQAILEANAVLNSKTELSDKERRTLKIVALLSSLGTQCPLAATEAFVEYALSPEPLGRSLEDLVRQSIVVYRRYNKTYALWSGSDVDLEECEKRADAELSKTGFSLAETLERFMVPEPLVAKRHSLETGSLRYFETHYVDRPSELSTVAHICRRGASGGLVVCLPERASEVRTFTEAAIELGRGDCSLVFAVPRECGDLREALKEVRRLHWIEDNEKALRDDRIASREVSVRLAEAKQGVLRRQYGLLDPRPAPQGMGCAFVCEGKVRDDIRGGRDLAKLLSELCDRLYSESPRIKNELINRATPSSQAAAARNALIKLLNTPEALSLPLLGIEGYPPERSIYESVFLASGMHFKGKDGRWHLGPPRGDAPSNLLPAWKKLDSLVFSLREKLVTVQEIYEELRRPPYGVLDGLIPLLIVAFHLVNRDETFLYFEDTFQPEATDAQFELLVRRPELFALSGMKIEGTRAAIVERLSKGLGTGSATVMPVVRKLYALRNSLSKYALETDAVSPRAKAFRKAFEEARSPEILLFRALPAVFGIGDLDAGRLDRGQLDCYFNGLNGCLHELGNALPVLVADSRKLLLEALGFDNDEEGWRLLYDRCCFLLARIGASDLLPFLRNVKNTDGDWTKAAQVMAFVAQTPMEKWGPLQKADFAKAILGFAERFAAAWRPYDGTVALSEKEAKAADALLTRIRATTQKADSSVLRAALLRALAELDGKEGTDVNTSHPGQTERAPE